MSRRTAISSALSSRVTHGRHKGALSQCPTYAPLRANGGHHAANPQAAPAPAAAYVTALVAADVAFVTAVNNAASTAGFQPVSFAIAKLGYPAFDVAVIVRFEAFSSLVNWVANLSPEKTAVPKFDEDSLISIKQASASAFLPPSRNADAQKNVQAAECDGMLMGRSFGSSPFRSREQYERYQQVDPQLGFAQ